MKLPSKKVFNLILLSISTLFFPVEKASAISVFDTVGLLDFSCMEITVVGACMNGPFPGILVKFNEPVAMVEVVNQPFTSVFEAMNPVLTSMSSQVTSGTARAVGVAAPVTSGSITDVQARTHLQFRDVHIYDFPFKQYIMAFIEDEGTCPPTDGGNSFIKYLSELDAMEWRIGTTELMHPKSIASASAGPICGALSFFGKMSDLCLGVWGPMFPRRGFFVHSSEVVASAAVAARALSIASMGNPPGHVVIENTGFDFAINAGRLQLLWPIRGKCIHIGQNPVTWEAGATSPTGKYLWLYWRPRVCCVY